MRTLATDSPEPGALRAEVRKTLGVVSGAHIRGVCAPVQQVWRAGAPGWVDHRAGDGAADTGTCRRANNCTGNRTGSLTTAADEWTAAGCSGRGV